MLQVFAVLRRSTGPVTQIFDQLHASVHSAMQLTLDQEHSPPD